MANRPVSQSPKVEFALSFSQQRLWFLEQLEPNTAVYNITRGLRLRGALDAACLEQALNDLVARHESLRTVFTERDGEPRQVVHAALTLSLPVSTVPTGTEPEAWMKDRLHEVATEPFDLARGPLLRCHLLRLAPDHHVLALVIHHIVSDGWSMGVLARDLSALYQARCRRQPPELPPLPIQYADFAVWQRATLEGPHLKQQLDYWTAQLDGLTELELPTDYRRPLTRDYSGHSRYLSLGPELTAALKTLSQQHNVTLFMTLLAALDVLLYRYTGHTDIAVGSAIAGRLRDETEQLIGFFVNTLVMRGDCSGNPSFSELLRRVRKTAIDAYTHQELPFEQLVEVLKPSRDLTRNPLFSVMLVLQNTPPGELRFDQVGIESVPMQTGIAKFDLTLNINARGDDLVVRIEYAAALFDDATIERLAGHFRTLLEAAVGDPRRRIGEMPMLGPAETHQLIADFNRTDTDYPRDTCIHALFQQQVRATPDALALVCGDRSLSYAELNRRANRLAHHLIARGVTPDTPVALCAERSLDTVVAMLAILKAGGGYVPLDPDYPAERLELMLEDCGARLVLTQSSLVGLLAGAAVDTVLLDRPLPDVGAGDGDPITATRPDHLAYVIYTSGSTGRPKGVMVEHRNVVRLVRGSSYVNIDAADRFLLLAPLSFDASTFELWGALLNGASCTVYPDRVPELDRLGHALESGGITILWLTSSLFNTVIDNAPEILRNVRQLLTGGEPLSLPHVERALELLPATALINGYGPTESTTFATTFTIPRTLPADWHSLPIGRPIANTRVYVVDPNGNPMPIGVPGELWIGGDGVARGYTGADDREAFIETTRPTGELLRVYRTGDLVAWHADGHLNFLGRLDDQIKLRGFRIEPGEIEATLLRMPEIREAVAYVETTAGGDRVLAACLVPEAGQIPDPDVVQRNLERVLPPWLVPRQYYLSEKLPTTRSGKLDRRAVAARPGTPLARPTTGAGEPRNDTEAAVLAIWRDLLGRSDIGVTDDFFAVGGHSLLATRMIMRVTRNLGEGATLQHVFEDPTVRGIAARLSVTTHAPARVEAPLKTLVTVRASGTRAPLFVMHGPTHELAGHLPEQQPVYGLSFLHAGDPVDGGRAEGLAAHYLAEIRSIRPRGPYRLVGYSFGGMVAWELARRLLEAGETVEYLGLIDPTAPSADMFPDLKLDGIPASSGSQRADIRVLSFMFRAWHGPANMIKDMCVALYEALRIDMPERLRIHHRLRSYLRGARMYRYRPMAMDVHVMGCEAHEFRSARQQVLWGHLTNGGRVQMEQVEGAVLHVDLLTPPNVARIAGMIENAMTRTRPHQQPAGVRDDPFEHAVKQPQRPDSSAG